MPGLGLVGPYFWIITTGWAGWEFQPSLVEKLVGKDSWEQKDHWWLIGYAGATDESERNANRQV